MKKEQQAANDLYKTHFGKIVASILQFSRDIDLGTAEDLVQDSFVAALTTWENTGIPDNPAGWIYNVCKNKALTKIKRDKKFKGRFENGETISEELELSESAFDDQQLKLLFACAHPYLSPKVQVVITLKYVVNLKAKSIARVLGMTIDGVDKLLLRARQKIKLENIFLKEPSALELRSRIPIVHKILYLIFNEGYKSSWGKELIREELCEDALLMSRSLLESKINNKDTKALYALMLFNAARFKSRFGTSGELLDLEEQDRSLWNKELVALASDYLKQSAGDETSSYQYEASIAYLHCTAKDFESTDWITISNLYFKLLQSNPNPFVELNYAIALYFAGKKETAFDLLNDLRKRTFLNKYYLLNATLGKLNFLEGNYTKAKEFYIKTLDQTNLQVEKDFILRMINKIREKEKLMLN
ncbi:MAG TPA: sigma-70 family RNA polymerase sigma factor [Chitinophagaceae bacterium]|jgi:RNA polymerase sigma-70 factor (ECF subfamily)|nr:sigma-70 family RNA polymerase sigma factor [Chitinophagaceae bacterium]